ncbi:inositol monophosphatase 1 isoform X3 [Dendrobates tinctorius]|uniref:inositol monophosphatase 1 isoform X3 n=1 Tax=Dendrobates tinctorius TaxID=92724 RepID=UPI003CCA507B
MYICLWCIQCNEKDNEELIAGTTPVLGGSSSVRPEAGACAVNQEAGSISAACRLVEVVPGTKLISVSEITVVCAALKEDVSVMVKSSPADLVTATDQKVEEMIISSIKEKYPSHSFIGEESVAAGQGSILTDNPTWIIDPIDGTTNFVHRFPFVAVSIGFAVNKQVEFGVVYSCVEDKMYTGRRGNGAYCNGQKLQISGQKDITKSMIITELGSNRDPDVMKIILSNMERLLCIPIHGIRAVGTAAVDMCLVATGGADAYYEMGIHCWDVAASSVIVTEAGGLVLDANGGPFDLMSRRVIAASSKEIGERIAKELQIISLERDDGKKE